MGKDYVAYVRDPEKVPEGEEIQLVIRDLTPGPRKYDARVVKCIVSSFQEKKTDNDTLHLRSGIGILSPHPKVIKVAEEMGTSLPGVPYGDVLGKED